MALLTWISLVFLVVAVVGSIALAVAAGLRAWRALKRLTTHTSSAIGDVLTTAGEAEAHAVRLSEGSEKLTAAVTHLQRSLAQLALLRSAATDARASLFAFRGAVPRK